MSSGSQGVQGGLLGTFTYSGIVTAGVYEVVEVFHGLPARPDVVDVAPRPWRLDETEVPMEVIVSLSAAFPDRFNRLLLQLCPANQWLVGSSNDAALRIYTWPAPLGAELIDYRDAALADACRALGAKEFQKLESTVRGLPPRARVLLQVIHSGIR